MKERVALDSYVERISKAVRNSAQDKVKDILEGQQCKAVALRALIVKGSLGFQNKVVPRVDNYSSLF